MISKEERTDSLEVQRLPPVVACDGDADGVDKEGEEAVGLVPGQHDVVPLAILVVVHGGVELLWLLVQGQRQPHLIQTEQLSFVGQAVGITAIIPGTVL